jgi:putative redox protein
MKATVNWNGAMTFVGAADSGFPVRMDTTVDGGGNDSGVRPMEMIALGLAGCTAMDVISILQKKRQNISKFEIGVDAPRSADYPKVFTRAVLTYKFTGTDIDEIAILRAIELSVTKYCPVYAMLEQAFPIDLLYEIYEDEGNGNRRLTNSGAWHELMIE